MEEEFDTEGINFGGGIIGIGGYGKLYDEQLEKFCLFIATLDKRAKGVIECSGEETTDLWRIIICDGKITIEEGRVTYDKKSREKFEDTETKEKVYKITKDHQLLKEIMVENLK